MLNKIKLACELYSKNNAFNIDSRFYTYYEFASHLSAVNNFVREYLGKEEKLIGVVTRESPSLRTYSAIYGVWFSGRGFVPVNPANPYDRNTAEIKHSGIKTILCDGIDDSVKKLSDACGLEIVDISGLQSDKINLELPEVNDSDIAYLLYTSGSTGTPKGVPVSRINLNSFIDSFFQLNYKVDQNDRFLQMFDLTFDFSIVCYTVPLCIGACVYNVPAHGVKYANVFNVLEQDKITFACMVPSMLSYLRPYFEDIKLEHLKYSLFCGEALYEEIASEWSKCLPNSEIINAYGPTEATVFCSTYNFKKSAANKYYNGILAIGMPLNSTDTIIIDHKLNPLPPGIKGEICLTGDQVIGGYWNNGVKNKQSFFKLDFKGKERIFYRTGDLGILDSEGDIFFLGRIDNQIKIQGFRIELTEIEFRTREFTGLSNVAAVVHPNKVGHMQIHLIIENYSGDTAEVEKFLKSKLPQYMLPASIVTVAEFPLNKNGKTDRRKLLKLIP